MIQLNTQSIPGISFKQLPDSVKVNSDYIGWAISDDLDSAIINDYSGVNHVSNLNSDSPSKELVNSFGLTCCGASISSDLQ